MANISPIYNASLAIKQEIQRFESVHPSIYAIYDLIEAIEDRELQDSIRDHVVCIEDSFVNSQEWTLSRNVPELKLGVVGSTHSGKSALVHRYLTGSYMQDESPEGGRFKKEVLLDGGSHLLLIRDEGRPPDQQFTAWCDACLFVFALDNAESFEAVYQFYSKMSQYRNLSEIPLLLVGTQDSISESRPRAIDEGKTRKCAQDLRRCSYFETCATYGHNVDRVFQEACHKIISNLRCTPTMQSAAGVSVGRSNSSNNNNSSSSSAAAATTPQSAIVGCLRGGPPPQQPPPPPPSAGMYNLPPPLQHQQQQQQQLLLNSLTGKESNSGQKLSTGSNRFAPSPVAPSPTQQMQQLHQMHNMHSLGVMSAGDSTEFCGSDPIGCGQYYEPPAPLPFLTGTASNPYQPPLPLSPPHLMQLPQHQGKPVKKSDSLLRDKAGTDEQQQQQTSEYTAYYASAAVPYATASLQQQQQQQQQLLGQRGARDRSSFAQSSEKSDKEATPNATPTQNRKTKRRSNLFNRKEAASSGGPPDEPPPPPPPSMQQFQQQQSLQLQQASTGVKVGPGRAIPVKQGSLYKKTVNALNREWKKKYVTLSEDGKLTYHPNLHDYMENSHGKDIELSRTTVKIPGQLRPTSNGLLKSHQQSAVGGGSDAAAGKKRRHRRAKSGNRGSGGGGGGSGAAGNDGGDVDESDGYEFMIVSLENRTWHFEASSQELRDEWVRAIEHSILRSLQGPGGPGSASGGGPSGSGAAAAAAQTSAIRCVFGNSECADCGKSAPDWASLNLGSVVCIECSGIHRQLGTHHSRVRSLSLDDWPAHHVLVMRAIGNKLANSVWEARLPCHATFRKPGPDSDREEKEIFIRAKYERREFLPDLPFRDSPVQQQLIDAIARSDTRQVILCLAVSGAAVNEPYSKQDPRAAIHIAATLGQLVYLQLLLWYGADPAVCDAEGRNALFYATAANKPDCADFLRAVGCPPVTCAPAATAAAAGHHAATLPRRRSKTTPTTGGVQQPGPGGGAPTQTTAEIGL